MACKKKRKRFMKIELLETSAVGTPAYADAHWSFFKEASDFYSYQLKGGQKDKTMAEEKEMISEEVKSEEVVSEQPAEQPQVEEAVSEVQEEVKSDVAEEVKSVETEKAVEVTEVKEVVNKEAKLDELISQLKEVLSKLPVERALVETKETKAESLKKASAGELFLAMLK